ncbi:MAG: co-chaperone GroES [bacterium]
MLKPLSKNVVLQKEEIQQTTSSGIILTTESKELPSVGLVLAVGPQCESGLQPGDKVVYKQYSGTKVTLDQKDYIVIDEENILASIA